jgi:hypothetical protein
LNPHQQALLHRHGPAPITRSDARDVREAQTQNNFGMFRLVLAQCHTCQKDAPGPGEETAATLGSGTAIIRPGNPYAPFDEVFHRDPHGVLGWYRKHRPVARVRLPGGPSCWLITRYEDAAVALADPRLVSDNRRFPATLEGIDWKSFGVDLISVLGRNLSNSDPPEAALGRTEAQVAISTLLRRFPRLALAVPPGALARRSSATLNGLCRLPVVLGGVPSAGRRPGPGDEHLGAKCPAC